MRSYHVTLLLTRQSPCGLTPQEKVKMLVRLYEERTPQLTDKILTSDLLTFYVQYEDLISDILKMPWPVN